MKVLLSFALLTLALCAPRRASAYEPPTATHAVEIVRYEWHDDARNRDVPVKVYFPKDGTSPQPIIIFSHGLGGSRENYEYLGQHWAGCGYVSVHLQHLGSDDAVWKNAAGADRFQALKKATLELSNTVNRPKDVSFAIDRLLALNGDASSPLKGRLDTKNIGMSGHSYGGFTTMAIAGQKLWRDKMGRSARQGSDPNERTSRPPGPARACLLRHCHPGISYDWNAR